MIPVLAWWIIGGIIALIVGSSFFNFTKKKHCWVIMGDSDSGKTELLCMLQDMERDPKGENELTHATSSTPASESKEVEVLNQTIVFCDGPGAIKRKKSRLHYLLNGPVKTAHEKKQGLVLLYTIDMEKLTNDDDREDACRKLFAEVGLFLKGLEQLCSTGQFVEAKYAEVSQDTLAAVGSKVFVIGTHMDKVSEKIQQKLARKRNSAIEHEDLILKFHEQIALERAVDEGKMSVLLSPFMRSLNFKFVFGDIYNYTGRCEFLKAFGDKLQE